jgi:hypothetical protein
MKRLLGLFLSLALLIAPAGSRADGVSGGGVNDNTFGGLIGASWVLPGASFDLNFASGQYYGGALSNNLSITRAVPAVTYATNADGTLTAFGPDTFRIGVGTGLLIENGATNYVLWNRDLTNVVWVKTSITAAKDQTGPDGTVNGASSITATGANGTVLQTITRASQVTYQTAYIKRITGSGTINMTTDNGTTWTVVTATANWTKVAIPAQTLANPICGFRIVTSGDKIAVDFVQNETGPAVSAPSAATSPIPTTTAAVSRADDFITWNASISNTLLRGPVSVVFSGAGSPITAAYTLLMDSVAHDDEVYIYAAGNGASWNGASELLATFGTGSMAGPTKLGYSLSAAGRSLVANNGTVATNAGIQTSVGTTATLGIRNTGGGAGYQGPIKRVTIWNPNISDSNLKAFTQ